MKKVASIFVIFLLISCSYKPILGDNYKYRLTSEDQREIDIEHCEDAADHHLKGVKARRAGKEAVRKGAIGSFFSGLFSFLIGGDSTALVKGAAYGAGIGATMGGVSTAAEGKVTPDQIKQRYVTRCLNKKGYSVLGWE